MLINCSSCSARVNGEIQKLLPRYFLDGPDGPVERGYRISLLKCPACGEPLVGKEELVEYHDSSFDNPEETIWSEAKRVWPNPESGLDSSIPKECSGIAQ